MCGWAKRACLEITPVKGRALWLASVWVIFPVALAFADVPPAETSTGLTQLIESNMAMSELYLEVSAPEARFCLLMPGDRLRVTVWGEPDLSFEALTLSAEGTLNLPLIQSIRLSGLNPQEAAAILTQAYRRFLRQPKLAVTKLNSEAG
ncbi:MAG: polysaccharide biosynthesis/export family protein, partial [Vampirovibrionales bacterium]|nr:polysaccharide biosynthesis/export family protein [Vampirovibrionales bacterium]